MRTRYFFDTNDGYSVVRDETGQELESLQEAQVEAARALTDLARDIVRGGALAVGRGPGSIRRRFAHIAPL
jgi:hypothetical protein